MPGTFNAGKDITVALLLDGLPVEECAAIDFTEEPQYSNIEVRPLGKSSVERDQDFEGYSGTITFIERNAGLQIFLDAYNQAIQARLPYEVVIVVNEFYPDGSSYPRTYHQVTVEFSSRYRRGEANQITCNWMTGKNRIVGGN